jgi:hypothetical protein
VKHWSELLVQRGRVSHKISPQLVMLVYVCTLKLGLRDEVVCEFIGIRAFNSLNFSQGLICKER